jgi:hypothetical protein
MGASSPEQRRGVRAYQQVADGLALHLLLAQAEHAQQLVIHLAALHREASDRVGPYGSFERSALCCSTR